MQFQKVRQAFVKLDAEILFIDPQEGIRVVDWKKQKTESYPIVADPSAWVCAQYGVAKQLVVHNEWVNLPASFIIDKRGILRYARLGRGWPSSERDSPKKLLEELAKLKRGGR